MRRTSYGPDPPSPAHAVCGLRRPARWKSTRT
jgi:hypothetical protein